VSRNDFSCAVLFSGAGTTARALLDFAAEPHSHYHIDLLVTNNPRAPGIALAAEHAIELLVLPDRRRGESIPRAQWDQRLAQRFSGYKLDLLVLAGFMRILSEPFVREWQGRIVNIHPSLLPKYSGLDTHRRALEGKESEHGFSIHQVTPELDSGPLLAQGRVKVHPADTPVLLQERVQEQERHFYPRVIELIATGRLHCSPERLLFDGNPLPSCGMALCEPDLL